MNYIVGWGNDNSTYILGDPSCSSCCSMMGLNRVLGSDAGIRRLCPYLYPYDKHACLARK